VSGGAGRLAGWFALAALVCLAGAGFVFLAGLKEPPGFLGTGPFRVTVDSDEGDEGIPTRAAPELEIPSIGVNTRVISLEKNSDGTLETPTNYDEAGWWSGGPQPGERGAAVITGHVDSRRSGPAVFARLGELRPGDIFSYTTRTGKRVRFEVEGSERYAKEDFPTLRVYGRSDKPVARLVTCTGNFDVGEGEYSDNLVVYARRI
jgi:LPXTG-site transpeptidase (sortase) family protein